MSNDTAPWAPIMVALGLNFQVFFAESLWARLK
jgi:hypothetical protein